MHNAFIKKPTEWLLESNMLRVRKNPKGEHTESPRRSGGIQKGHVPVANGTYLYSISQS